MGTKRLNNNSKDVFVANANNTMVQKNRITFSRAMVRLGTYVTYCVILLLKKLNKILRDSVKAFSSRTTALITGVISKFKKVGRNVLKPFVSCIKISNKKYKAVSAAKDVTVSSVADSRSKQFFSKAVNYAVPVAAVLVFATVLSSAKKVESTVDSYISGQSAGIEINADSFIAASDELSRAEIISLDSKLSSAPVQADFKEPYELVNNLMGCTDANFIKSSGIYIDNQFMGAVMNDSSIKEAITKKLDDASAASDDIVSVSLSKNVEYRAGQYSTTAVVDPQTIIDYINGGKEECHYTIQEGDSLITIAQAYNMTVDDLLAINPQITDPDLCLIGDDLIVQVNMQNIPVCVTKRVEETVSVAYETMTVNDDSMYAGQQEILIDGVNGENKNIVEVTYENDKEVSRKVVEVQKIKDPVSEMLSVGTKKQEANPLPTSSDTVLAGSGQYIWPVNGGYISDTFGGYRNHKGLDIAAPSGTAIYAAGEGTVIAAGWNTGGYGYFVMIDHGDGYVTLYGHMSKVIAVNGAKVGQGELIGEVGTTGDSTGNHLHFEVRCNNICQNPANFIKVNN
ncbi:MAG: M23 family metallopeptidase [Oscillospiraceae bacterium]|nr:M23 family metallopeptidase [Oscillospiraceae bacterium]